MNTNGSINENQDIRAKPKYKSKCKYRTNS